MYDASDLLSLGEEQGDHCHVHVQTSRFVLKAENGSKVDPDLERQKLRSFGLRKSGSIAGAPSMSLWDSSWQCLPVRPPRPAFAFFLGLSP